MAAKKEKPLNERLKPTQLNHIFNFDVADDGIFREIAIVKLVRESADPKSNIVSMHYIDVALLDMVDKGRLKALVTNVHANKYELWDLMSLPTSTLNNGKNALDYFHQLVKVARGPGAVNTQLGGGLANVRPESNAIVGANFTDPTSGTIESGS